MINQWNEYSSRMMLSKFILFCFIFLSLIIVTSAQSSCTKQSCDKLIIPNVITPNQDGLNDQFTILLTECSCFVTQFKMNVFNRWGTCVYEETRVDSNSTPFKWQGENHDNTQLSAGVYFYKIEMQYRVNEELYSRFWKGWVKIIH